jgi:putative FmdB family regulatory protein
MPLYDIVCKECGKTDSIFRKIAQYNDLPKCCNGMMSRIISAPFVPQEFQPYRSMIDGHVVTDRGEHRRHLKAHGCTETGNEDMTPKRDLFKEKRESEAMKYAIAERINTI